MLASIWGGVFCTFISPMVAKYGDVNAFIALKSFQGLIQGQIFPGTMNIISVGYHLQKGSMNSHLP